MSPSRRASPRRASSDDLVADYGHVIVDECHHLSAQTFESVVRRAKARFVVGLSATVARKDGHHPIVPMQCGPVRYRVNARVQAAAQPFEHVVLVQPTGFRSRRAPDPDRRVEFQALYQELVADTTRNRRIADDVTDAVNSGRSPLVLTRWPNPTRVADAFSMDGDDLVLSPLPWLVVYTVRDDVVHVGRILHGAPRWP